MHAGYELAIIISYPTSVREINAHKMLRILIDFTVFVKTTWFSACFEQMRIVTIFGEHGIMAHIPWWLSPRITLSSNSVFNNRGYPRARRFWRWHPAYKGSESYDNTFASRCGCCRSLVQNSIYVAWKDCSLLHPT